MSRSPEMTREETHYDNIKGFTFHYDSDDSRSSRFKARQKRRKKARMSVEERRQRQREATRRWR